MTGENSRGLLQSGIRQGLYKGWMSFLWIAKIILPISFFTAVLSWSGFIDAVGFLVHPVMTFFGLPAVAAVPLVIGMLTGIYGGIAAMAVLPMTVNQMTLVALFLLIAHNLVQESAIQGSSGVHPLKAAIFRIVTALVTVFTVSFFLDLSGGVHDGAGGASAVPAPVFTAMVRDWAMASLLLMARIFVIVMIVLGFLEIAKVFGWIRYIARFLNPFLRVMGLSDRVGLLWLTAVVFGLAYGGAVIVEEAKSGNLSDVELQELHLSIGINHAMIEDPALFLPLGIHPFWLWVPRFVVAVLAVRLLTFWYAFRGRETG